MNSKAFTRKALSLCLSGLLILTSTSFVLATQGKVIGDIQVFNLPNGESPQVMVNSELAKSGTTIFSSNSIVTPENAGTTARFGKYGSVEIAPNSIVSFSASNDGIIGEVSAGQITSFSKSLTIKTVDGKTIAPKFGETVNATGVNIVADDEKDANGNCIDKDNDGVLECDTGGAGWWIWGVIAGGAVVGILVATLSENNRVALGGGSTVVSPTR